VASAPTFAASTAAAALALAASVVALAMAAMPWALTSPTAFKAEPTPATELCSALLPEFVAFYRQQIQDYVGLHCPELTAEHFFGKLCRDAIFELNEGTLLPVFKQAMYPLMQADGCPDLADDAYLMAA
jgi:hypothetical protein